MLRNFFERVVTAYNIVMVILIIYPSATSKTRYMLNIATCKIIRKTVFITSCDMK